MNIKKFGLVTCLSASLLFTGCSKKTETTTTEETKESSSTTSTATGDSLVGLNHDDMFTERDLKNDYDESDCIAIQLNGDSATCDSDGVTIDGSTITISQVGNYILSGTLDNGQVIVDTEDTVKVQLILNGVTITNSGNIIYGKNADKLFVTTAKGSTNTLTSNGEFETIDDKTIDGTIYASCDLTCNGEGSLNIQSTGHGIVTKDDLVMASGTYEINSDKQGLSGKDSVRIADGSYTINAGTDAIRSESDNEEKGFIYIANGDFTITSSQDCISASLVLEIMGGNFNCTAGGGSENASGHNDDMFRGFADQSESTDSTSMKGLKSDGGLAIQAGTFDLNCADDTIHSGGNVYIAGGTLNLASGDDGIHSDALLDVQNGEMNITSSYEGLEGTNIQMEDGNVTINASDDGLNAAGGSDGSGFGQGMMENPMAGDDSYTLTISGGNLYVLAGGDGLDSNGVITIEGGDIWVDGPSDDGNAAIDYGTSATISGGTLVALGGSGMAEQFDESSTQGVMLVSFDQQEAGSEIVLKDADGNEIVSGTSAKSFDCAIVSAPAITTGNTYTLTCGSATQDITMDSIVYGSGSGMGNPGGGQGDRGSMDMGNRQGGGQGGGGQGGNPGDGEQPSDPPGGFN